VTDRHSGFLVILGSDIREDDSGPVLAALRMIRGVVRVTPVPADLGAGFIATQRRDLQWQQALLRLGRDGPGEAGQ